MNEILKVENVNGAEGIQALLNQFRNMEPHEALQEINKATDYIDNLKDIEVILKQIRRGILNKLITSDDTVNERLFTIQEAADKLGCHRSTVYNLHIKNGLKTVNFGNRHQKIKASDLEAYIRNL